MCSCGGADSTWILGCSLGAAYDNCAMVTVQIYAAMCGKTGRPHHLYRLILLTPAGFLKKTPWVRLGHCFRLPFANTRPQAQLTCPPASAWLAELQNWTI